MKTIYIIIIILIYICYIIKKKNSQNKLNYNVVYNTGGYYGFYQLGVCHYIKNNFNYKDKSCVGISAGAWLSLFMNLDKEYTNAFLLKLFKNLNRTTPIYKLPSIFKSSAEPFVNNISIKNINILVTNLSEVTYKIHNKFLSVNDIIECCTASSFVPFVTYKELFYFYNHKMVVDGGLFKKIYINEIDTDKTLIIKYDMFGRFKQFKLFKCFRRPKYSSYELYLLGYKDASKNHAYLQKYFN
jgi:hypothetical protein